MKALFFQRVVLGIVVLFSSVLLVFADGRQSKIHPMLQVFLEQERHSFPKTLAKTTQGIEGCLSVIVYTRAPEKIRAKGIHLNTVTSLFSTAQLTPDQVRLLAEEDAVEYLAPSSINFLQLDVSNPDIGASLVRSGFLNSIPYRGEGAIVLVYDTGIDWKHPDFRKEDTSQTRLLCVWDQTLTPQGNERSPEGFNYGVEYTAADIHDELDGTPTGFVREQDYNGHGTHVLSIAAGNGRASDGKFVGIAPEADLIVVKGGESSFDEAKMIDCLTYAKQKAQHYGKPIVVNWSIGGQYGAHDGTRPYEVAVDSFSGAGRVVCIAAGNDANFPIHTSGFLSKNSSAEFTLVQPPYIPSSDSLHHYFDFMIWFQGDVTATGPNALKATVESPSGIVLTCQKDQNEVAQDSTDGKIYLSNYSAVENNHRCIELYVQYTTVAPPRPGTWKLTVTTSQTSAIAYDAWITIRAGARDIPYLSLVNGDNEKTVSMPGTSRNAITVGSYVTKWQWPAFDGSTYSYDVTENRTGNISLFSGRGPTRDGRLKPDLTAPGEGITAALSSSKNKAEVGAQLYLDWNYKIDRGTSQATPHITGAAAVLLGINPTLTAQDIRSLLTISARSDGYATGLPNAIWGYGKLDLLNAAAHCIGGTAASATRFFLSYNAQTNGGTEILTGNKKIALRFTPSVTSTVTEACVEVSPLEERSLVGNGSLCVELYGANGNEPAEKIGSTVLHPLTQLMPSTRNYLSLVAAGVNVLAGGEYFIVLSLSNTSDTVRLACDGVASGRSMVFNGTSWVSAPNGNFKIQVITALLTGISVVSSNEEIPSELSLSQNYPNPFNPVTTLRYDVPEPSHITLKVYDILGREVCTLVEKEEEEGSYTITFDGSRLASGVYVARLEAQSKTGTYRFRTIEMVLLK